MVASSGHRGPIWWAMHHRQHHRQHHRHSDGPLDLHSPVTHSLWHAHMGWLAPPTTVNTDLDAVEDLSRVPELVWINRWHMIFPLLVLVATVLLGAYTPLFGSTGMGWAAAVWAFFVPTVLGLHAAFAVNTLTQGRRPGIFSHRRFATGVSTISSGPLTIPTMGACWHNNHHRAMNAARAGFHWWQLDLSYLTIRAMQALRLMWGLQVVPAAVLAEGRQPLGPPLPEGGTLQALDEAAQAAPARQPATAAHRPAVARTTGDQERQDQAA